MHLGSFLGLIPHILKRHPMAEMQPGDVFCGNDAYEGGGTHLPDIVLAEPVFVDGEIIAFAVNLAHHADFADRGHAHIYQEGLRIPPIRLYRAGELQHDVQELILLNCQVPRERLSDFRAQMAANRLGVQRMHGAVREIRPRYRAARRRRAAGLRRTQDARRHRRHPRWHLPLRRPLRLPGDRRRTRHDLRDHRAGDEMHLHFDGPPQVRAGLNMTYTALLSTVYYAVKTLVDPTILPNAGLARPLHVTAPEGTVVNCVHPAAVNGRLGACQRVVDLIHGALAEAVPERVIAATNGACTSITFAGHQPHDNALWVYLETIGGGSGARATKDGLDGVHVHMTNTSNLPVEALEIEYPLTLLRYELVDGSGGPGRHRGGMGLRRVYRAEAPCRVRVDIARRLSAPWGLFGGLPGGKADVVAARRRAPASTTAAAACAPARSSKWSRPARAAMARRRNATPRRCGATSPKDGSAPPPIRPIERRTQHKGRCRAPSPWSRFPHPPWPRLPHPIDRYGLRRRTAGPRFAAWPRPRTNPLIRPRSSRSEARPGLDFAQSCAARQASRRVRRRTASSPASC